MQNSQNGEDTKKDDYSSYLSNFIKELINQNVYVKLIDESEFNGKLISFDSSFNLVLENCKEIKSLSISISSPNKLNSNNFEIQKNLKETFIRGNNVAYLSLQ